MTALDDHRRLGDQYTFVALDPETKIVPAYPVGKRDLPTATAFITDLSERLANRATSKRLSGLSVQISTTARWLNFTKLSQWDGAGKAAARCRCGTFRDCRKPRSSSYLDEPD
jgi:hypothetical protein